MDFYDLIETDRPGVKILTIPVEPLDVNASLVICKKSGEAVLIDPGGEEDRLIALMEEQGAVANGILLTHAHFDHCMAVDPLMEYIGEKIGKEPVLALHEADRPIYENMEHHARFFGMHMRKRKYSVNRPLAHGDTIALGSLEIEVIHTPGHSPGSSSFYLRSDKVLFSGDTLFALSIGRTDLPGGDYQEILRSIRERLMVLDEETEVIPGHSEFTTIGREKRLNPFVASG